MNSLTSEHVIRAYLDVSSLLELSKSQLSQLIIVMRQQKILARVAHSLVEQDLIDTIEPRAQRHFRNALLMSNKQQLQVWEEAELLVSQLDGVSPFLIFLKGAAYSLSAKLTTNKVAAGRIYSDIDVLVDRESLKLCEQTLAIKGWLAQEVTDYDDKYYRKWAHEIPPMSHGKRGTIIDIHHNIVPLISKVAPNVNKLLNHAVNLGDGIWVLSPAAQFVHSAIHLFRNEEFDSAFRDLTDLHIMLKAGGAEFEQAIIEVAEEIGFSKEAALAFHFVAELDSSAVNANGAASAFIKANPISSVDKYIFSRVLFPQHPFLEASQTPFRGFLALLRGHLQKMPLHILTYHLFVKLCRWLAESVAGKHIFTPLDENQKRF
ncbi:nucleotidyltransferase domain-containing protein [Agaribacter flavus]|uniref:Nucleotidyltransferase family protein n=1 Tax=Agaribacter flavus TaxID=1902781 RepID=A0ABV7FNU3_9ALTE